MEWRVGTYERAKEIFDRQARLFHPLTRIVAFTAQPDAVEVVVAVEGGSTAHARITFPDPEVLRLQWAPVGAPTAHTSEMLDGPPPSLPLAVEEREDALVVHAGGTPVVLGRHRWQVTFGGYTTVTGDRTLLEPVNVPSGWAEQRFPPNRVSVYETFALRPDEELWGLGERFLGPRLRGRRLAHFIDEPGGANTTDRTYKSVPFVLSSRGYGLFVHHGEEAWFDLGATSNASAAVWVDSDELDLFVVLGTPKQMMTRYTALTGRAPEVPEWAFGIWLSKAMYASRDEVETELAQARTHGIPIDVVGLDPMWLRNRRPYRFDWCDFQWDDEHFGKLDEFTGWLHGQDIRLCLWVNPNLVEECEAWDPDLLVSKGRARESCFPVRGFVDFTGAGGDWWVEQMQRLRAAGVDAFKLDYGELVPVDGVFADGRTGRQLHNLYGLLASMTAARAGVPFHYTRSGTAGSQRYPTHWPGDAQSTWAGLAGTLRGGISAAWSGFAHWSTDIGGFHLRDDDYDPADPLRGLRRPEPELFVRWTQFGMLAPQGRYHGLAGREPWYFGEEAIAVARDFGLLRKRLLPYLVDCAREATRSGWPIMRPMAFEFSDDPSCRAADLQYLLGPDLLVAPIVEPGGNVTFYVPEGGWTDHFTGERLEGPRWVTWTGVPLDRIPLLVREDAPNPLA